jgi:hypothetical protein
MDREASIPVIPPELKEVLGESLVELQGQTIATLVKEVMFHLVLISAAQRLTTRDLLVDMDKKSFISLGIVAGDAIRLAKVFSRM